MCYIERVKKETKRLEGTISVSSKGTGYVRVEGYKEDIEIPFANLNTALHGDRVEITAGRQTGKVVKIISRAKKGFAGVLEKEGGRYFLKPDDSKMYTDILIPKGGKTGEKVFVEITGWRDPKKAPEGKVVKVLGRPGDNDAEMEAISLEKGFGLKLPEKTEQEARKIKERGITKEDYEGRRDFRKVLTFTIDPADAKDFDDALSFREVPEGYEIGIHIADVSHYVRPGSELDREAGERGTSVYLVDRVIPMLPEVLSNDLCSLLPDKDRLTMSAVFVLDKNAKVKKEWFGRTVIRSQKRYTYEEAETAIKAKHGTLTVLNTLAKKLTKERFANGAVSLDQEEVKFVLDQKGVPLKVIKKERGDSNKLIEEFMLLANRKVAEKMSGLDKQKNVFVYRVHDKPNADKMADLALFLSGLGYKVKMQNGAIPSREINSILEELEGRDEKDAVHKAVIRSMAKAIYSTGNIGHYGLAFRHYTHFTSPIRRYPDIVVHRLLSEHLAGKKIGAEKLKMYEGISRSASEMEKRASDAERASVKYKQVEYMSSRVGRKFEGVVSGIKEWGIYVEENETKCEGLVRMRDPDEKKYRLGTKVKIKVRAVDLERKTIDYVLI